MINQRIISIETINSDSFVDMTQSARLLYYDLSIRADDFGFVSSPKNIMRMVGGIECDLELLILKKFITRLASGGVLINS